MKKFLEDLIFLGVAEDTVTVFGKKWTLKTLTSEEHLTATNNTSDYETLSRIYALKLEILARAIKSVENNQLTDLAETLEFVRKLQPIVVNKLYEEYEKLQQKQNETLNDLGEIKN